jgi:manganese oxidase
MSNRRSFLQSALALGATFSAAPKLFGAPRAPGTSHRNEMQPGIPIPVNTPDLTDLPFKLDGGVKVFNLIAEPVKQEIIPGKIFDLWGYNGSAPGPTIQVNQGDRVRIVFDNHLPEPTSIHWHGLEIPESMDGVPGIGQKPVSPGGRFIYEFTLHQEGTYFYHSHMAMQQMLGMLGAFILQPRQANIPAVTGDHVILLQEYAVLPNNTVPNTMSMEYNWLTFNGKAGPAATPIVVRQGDRVRIRLINLGMDHHPIHLHGFTFAITGNEAGRLPEAQWIRRNTVLVGVAQAQDIEFDANTPGSWMLHCHLPHHMMNQMTSNVGSMTRIGSGISSSADMLDVAKNANQVPGFPQDAYMESPMMAMDKMVEKPETFGLPPGWSGYSGGMMTLVRVLPPDQYAQYLSLKKKQSPNDMQNMPGMGGNRG